MTLIKKSFPIPQKEMPPEKKKVAFDTIIGFVIVIIVMALIVMFFPMLIFPLLK